MMQKLAIPSAWMVSILFVSLSPMSLHGRSPMDEKAKSASAGPRQTVTGCLQKGDEPGGFTITGEDGKVWELHGKKVPLADHVGHTVTVAGSAGSKSKEQEEKIEASEKKEAGEKEHGDLRVTGLKMISNSCK